MSSQRLRRWSDIVQMLFKCFVFAGMRQCRFIWRICRVERYDHRVNKELNDMINEVILTLSGPSDTLVAVLLSCPTDSGLSGSGALLVL